MKKVLSLCIMLCLALSLCVGVSATAFAAVNAENAEYVYVYNDQGWNIYGYCYENKDDGGDLGGGWSDTPLTYVDTEPGLGDYWWRYPVPREAAGKDAMIIIYNSKNQDDDRITFAVPARGGKVYFNTFRNEGFATPEDAIANNFEKTFTSTGNTRVYFYNSERWPKVRAYCWGTEEYLGGWPGKYATKDESRENWYYIDINQDCAQKNLNVIFNNNNGGEQTAGVNVISSPVYVNIENRTFSGYVACEAETTMAKTAEDFMMDLDSVDKKIKTDRVTVKPSLIAPIVVLSVAAAACIGLGTAFAIITVRRKKK